MIDVDIEIIDALALEDFDGRWSRRSDLPHDKLDRATGGGGQIRTQHAAYLVNIGETRLVQTVEIELERFRFDQVWRTGGYAELANRHLRLAALIQPGQLVRIPDIDAVKRQSRAETQRVTAAHSRDRKQQGRIVRVAAGNMLAESGIMGRVVHCVIVSAHRRSRSMRPLILNARVPARLRDAWPIHRGDPEPAADRTPAPRTG